MLARSVLILCVVSALVLGCAGSAKQINHLQVGMTKADVINVMGEPDYTSGRQGVEVLSYRLTAGGFFSEIYFVRIVEGKVDRFGRQGDFGIY